MSIISSIESIFHPRDASSSTGAGSGSTPTNTGTTIPVSAATGGTSTVTTAGGIDTLSNSSTQTVTQSEFLQLLVAQLKNQDPDQPVDNTQMLAQLAQFSSLQAMTNLNTTMTAASQYSGLTQSAMLIGMNVATTDSSGNPGPTGTVSAVTMTGGAPYLTIGTQSVLASEVTSVTPPGTSATSTSTTGTGTGS